MNRYINKILKDLIKFNNHHYAKTSMQKYLL